MIRPDGTVIHYTECDEQPDGFPCICDHLQERDSMIDTDIQIEEATHGEVSEQPES